MKKNRIIILLKNCWRIKRLLEIEEQFNFLNEFSPSILIQINNGSIIYANKKAYEIFGYNPTSLGQLSITQFIVPEQKQELLKNLASLKSGEKQRETARYKMINQNGHIFSAVVIIKTIIKRKKFLGALVTIIDNSEQEEIENSLRTADINKNRFLSIIAHDLRSPISASNSLIQLLVDDYDDSDDYERKRIIKTIENSIKNVSNLLENLLTWSRIQINGFLPNTKKVNLRRQIEITLDLLSPMIIAKQITVSNKVIFDLQVAADADMLQTVLRNLISNALKFTPNQRGIIINSLIREMVVDITIEDNGIGMSPDTLKKIFKMETICSNRGTNDEKGAGLGLLICQEMINKMGGAIWAESEVDKGSNFHFTLPIA